MVSVKPKKPQYFSAYSKPTKPVAPSKKVSRYTTLQSIDLLHWSGTVDDLIDQLELWRGQNLSVESYAYDDYGSCVVELITLNITSSGTIENPNYELQDKAYQIRLEQYKKELAEWTAYKKYDDEQKAIKKEAAERKKYKELEAKYGTPKLT